MVQTMLHSMRSNLAGKFIISGSSFASHSGRTDCRKMHPKRKTSIRHGVLKKLALSFVEGCIKSACKTTYSTPHGNNTHGKNLRYSNLARQLGVRFYSYYEQTRQLVSSLPKLSLIACVWGWMKAMKHMKLIQTSDTHIYELINCVVRSTTPITTFQTC